MIKLCVLTSILSLPGLAILVLFSVSSTGCLCDCGGTYNQLTVSSQVPLANLSINGDVCQAPTCEDSTSGGGCTQYRVQLKQAGACQFTATAVDGRQTSASVNVHFTKNTCCGNMYAADSAVDLMFAAPDASPVFDGPGY